MNKIYMADSIWCMSSPYAKFTQVYMILTTIIKY